ncbi:MAG: DNA/RNA non-specific endonuclease [Tidjanibacter sp.]|nr:DNA/RNA non-specific endonuclease [Tidjanibacter sp.]
MSILGLAACNPSSEPKDPLFITVSPKAMTFDAANPSANVVTVSSNSGWSLTVSDSALRVDRLSGNAGDTPVTVTDMPEGQAMTITFTTDDTDAVGNKLTARTTITRMVSDGDGDGETFTPEVIYYDDFGTGATTNTNASNYTGWNPTGAGASTVDYLFSTNSQMKNDTYGSSGRYTGASGGNYVRTYYDKGIGRIVIRNITLPNDVLNYTLSLGTEFTSTEGTIALSSDGITLVPLTFTTSAAYGRWVAVTIDFSLAKAVDRLFIHIVANNATAAYGINIDDVKLITSNKSGQRVDFVDAVNYRWAELPAAVENSDYAYNTYWTTTVKSRQVVRNYSYCYDKRCHNPIWVAYPLHECYREGGYGRTNPDPWHKAEELAQSEQSIIYPIEENGTTYQYWTYDILYQRSWTRGHLCRSADRGGANTEINIQTFVPTNIAPQAKGRFSELWADTEALVSGGDDAFTEQICSDTLYVVVGCHYQNDNNYVYDACVGSTTSTQSKQCIVPTHQYKLLLRTRSGSLGKPVQECSASELRAIGFWFDAVIDDSDTRTLKDFAKSIDQIEALTGVDFFPDAPAEVESSFALSDWGL